MSSTALLLTVLALGASPAALLSDAKKLYKELEYDRVVPIAEEILRSEGTTIDQKLDAYLLKGSCLAILGNSIEAEKAFRLLLRVQPSFDLTADVSPKIIAVLRKVQNEERALADQLKAIEREKVIAQLEIEGLPEPTAKGGFPIVFELRVKDEKSVVASVSLRYRRIVEPAFSSLALFYDPDRRYWITKVPAEWTANEGGFRMEYYVTTADRDGHELITAGSAEQPYAIDISSGDIPTDPFYESPWFWIGAAALVVGSSIGGYFVFRDSSGPDTDLGSFDVP
jgi:tetratricopeptide (TPR) repeat protein